MTVRMGVIGGKPKRICRLRQATREFLSRSEAQGRQVEGLVEHLTFLFLLKRPLLSVFHYVYAWGRRVAGSRAPFPPEVRAELQLASALLPLARADLEQ